jgi:hypothetical protein
MKTASTAKSMFSTNDQMMHGACFKCIRCVANLIGCVARDKKRGETKDGRRDMMTLILVLASKNELKVKRDETDKLDFLC